MVKEMVYFGKSFGFGFLRHLTSLYLLKLEFWLTKAAQRCSARVFSPVLLESKGNLFAFSLIYNHKELPNKNLRVFNSSSSSSTAEH